MTTKVLNLKIGTEGVRKNLNEVNAGLKLTQKIGKKTASALGKGFKSLGKSLFSLKSAVVGLAGVGGFGALLVSSLNTIDRIGKLSTITGISTERLGAFSLAAQLAGTSLDAITTSARDMGRKVQEFIVKGTGEGKEAFEQLGISQQELIPIQNDTVAQLSLIADKFKDMDDGANKATIAMRLMGESGTKLIPLLNQGSDAIDEITIKAKEMGLAMSRDTVQGVEDANDAMTLFSAHVKGTVLNAVATLAPGIKRLFDELSTQFAAFVADQGGPAALGQTMATSFLSGLKSMINGFATFLGVVTSGVNSLITLLAKIPSISGVQIKGMGRSLNEINSEMLSVQKQQQKLLDTSKGAWDDSAKAAAVLQSRLNALSTEFEASRNSIELLGTDFDVSGMMSSIDTAIAAVARLGTAAASPTTAPQPGGGQIAPPAPSTLAQEIAAEEAAASSLATLQTSLMTEEETLLQSYQNRSTIINTAQDLGIINEQVGYNTRLALAQQFSDQNLAILDQQAKQEQQLHANRLSAAAGIFGALASLSAGAGKKAFERQKKLNRLSVILGTSAAIMNALAVSPYPLGVALAVGAGIKGAAQLAAINRTSYSGGGSVTPSGGANFSSAPITAPTVAPQAPIITTHVTIIEKSTGVIIEEITDQTSNGRIIIDPNSPQAEIIRTGED